jgi:hypothetical protein
MRPHLEVVALLQRLVALLAVAVGVVTEEGQRFGVLRVGLQLAPQVLQLALELGQSSILLPRGFGQSGLFFGPAAALRIEFATFLGEAAVQRCHLGLGRRRK